MDNIYDQDDMKDIAADAQPAAISHVQPENFFSETVGEPPANPGANETIIPKTTPGRSWKDELMDGVSIDNARESARQRTRAEKTNPRMETQQEASLWGAAEHALGNQNIEAFANAMDHLGDWSGDPWWGRKAQSIRDSLKKDGSAYRPVYESYKQIGGLKDFWGYTKETIGQQIGVMAPGILGATVLGSIGATQGELVGGKLGARVGGAVGGIAGVTAGTIHLHVSDMREALQREGVKGESLVNYTNMGAAVLMSLDAAFPAIQAAKLGGFARKQVADKVAQKLVQNLAQGGKMRTAAEFTKQFGREIIKDAVLLEVPTELAQEAITELGAKQLAGKSITAGDVQKFATETAPEIALRTILGAGGMAMPGAGAQAYRDVRDAKRDAVIPGQKSATATGTGEEEGAPQPAAMDGTPAAEAASGAQPVMEDPSRDPTPNPAAGAKGNGVLQFIRSQGGLLPDGEFAALSADRVPGLVSENGKSIAEMRDALVEAGYLEESGPDQPDLTSHDDVYDLVQRAMSGERIVPLADQQADEDFQASLDSRDAQKQLAWAEDSIVLPAIEQYNEETGDPTLGQVYRKLRPDDRIAVIERVRDGEDVVNVVEEIIAANVDTEAVQAMVAVYGPNPELIERVRALLAEQQPDLLHGFDEMLAQFPTRRARVPREPARRPGDQPTELVRGMGGRLKAIAGDAQAFEIALSEMERDRKILKDDAFRIATDFLGKAPKKGTKASYFQAIRAGQIQARSPNNRSIFIREGEGALRTQMTVLSEKELADIIERRSMVRPKKGMAKEAMVEWLVKDAKEAHENRIAAAGGGANSYQRALGGGEKQVQLSQQELIRQAAAARSVEEIDAFDEQREKSRKFFADAGNKPALEALDRLAGAMDKLRAEIARGGPKIRDMAQEIGALGKQLNAAADSPRARILTQHAAMIARQLPNAAPGQQTLLGGEARDILPNEPAIPVSKSVTPAAIVSLIDGSKHADLRGHLKKQGIDVEDYARNFRLADNYPLVAANVVAEKHNATRQTEDYETFAKRFTIGAEKMAGVEAVQKAIKAGNPQALDAALPKMNKRRLAEMAAKLGVKDKNPIKEIARRFTHDLREAAKFPHIGEIGLGSPDPAADKARGEQMRSKALAEFAAAADPSVAVPTVEPAVAPAAPRDLLRELIDLANSKTPRDEWAARLGLAPHPFNNLITQAVQAGILAYDKRGVARRSPEGQKLSAEGIVTEFNALLDEKIPTERNAQGRDVPLKKASENWHVRAKAVIAQIGTVPLADAQKIAAALAGRKVSKTEASSRPKIIALVTKRIDSITDSRLKSAATVGSAAMIAPGRVAGEDVMLTPEAESKVETLQRIVDDAVADILPAHIRADVVANIEIGRLAREDELFALRSSSSDIMADLEDKGDGLPSDGARAGSESTQTNQSGGPRSVAAAVGGGENTRDARILRQESATLRENGSIISGRVSTARRAADAGTPDAGALQPIGTFERFDADGFTGVVSAASVTDHQSLRARDARPSEYRLATLTYRLYDRQAPITDAMLEKNFQPNFRADGEHYTPLVWARVSQHMDGTWEVSMVQRMVDHHDAPKGMSGRLYAAIEKDLGIRMSPSGILSEQGYAMWQKRSPESVKWHQWSEFEGYYISPRRIKDNLDAIGKELRAISQRPDADENKAFDLANARKERGELIKLWGKLPVEARAETPNMFSLSTTADILLPPNAPAFRNWFGDSKVVDADGKPLVVYHGTARGGFDQFDTYGSKYGLFGQGGYFTEDPAVASEYTDKGIVKMRKSGQEAQTVYPVYLSIKNPIDMDAAADISAWVKAYADYLDEADLLDRFDAPTNERLYREVEEILGSEDVPSSEGAEIMQDGLRAMGYDGITHIGGGRVDPGSARHRVWIAFDPEQIKSATGNRGTFNPNDPRLSFSLNEQNKALGQTDPYAESISISARAAEEEARRTGRSIAEVAVSAARHEALEFFLHIGVVTAPEWANLQRVAQKENWVEETGVRKPYTDRFGKTMGPQQLEDLILKEAIMEKYGRYRAGNYQPPSWLGKIFKRITNFANSIISGFRKEGFQTWEDIFQKADKGELRRRYEEIYGRTEKVNTQAMIRAGVLPDARGIAQAPGVTRPPRPSNAPQTVIQRALSRARPIRALSELMADFQRAAGLSVRTGRIDPALQRQAAAAGGQANGLYNGVARVRVQRDFDTFAHEAGHHLERLLGGQLRQSMAAYSHELLPMASPVAGQGNTSLSEGFAEFFRRYLTNEQAARAQAPGFYRSFETLVEAENPRVYWTMQDIQDEYDRFLMGDPLDRGAAQQTVLRRPTGTVHRFLADAERDGFVSTMADRLYEFHHGYIQNIWDKRHGWWMATRDLLDEINRVTGRRITLAAADNPNKLLRMTSHTQAWAMQDLKEGIALRGRPNGGGVSMHQVLATAFGGTARDQWNEERARSFGDYLIARRAVQLYVRFRPQSRQVIQAFVAANPQLSFLLPRLPTNIVSEIDRPPTAEPLYEHLNRLLRHEQQNPQFRQAAELYYRFNKDMIELLFEKGLITREEKLEYQQDRDYAPFQRDMSDRETVEGEGIEAKRPPRGRDKINKYDVYRRLNGSMRDIINPIQSTVQTMFEIRLRAAINDTLSAMDRLARQAGQAGNTIFERLPPTQARATEVNIREQLRQAARAAGMSPTDTAIMLTNVESQIGQNVVTTMFTQQQASEKGEKIVWFFENGKPIPAQLPDGALGRMMFEGLTAVGQRNMGQIMAALAWTSGAVRTGVTLSFGFMIRNIITDAIASTVNSPYARPVLTQASGLREILRGGQYMQMYNRYAGMMGGAGHAALSDQSIERDIEALRQRGFHVRVPRTIGEFLKLVFQVGEFSETATRVGIFRNAMRSAMADGMSQFEAAVEAAHYAHDVLDFSQHGSKTEALRRTIPFFNAALQGLYKYSKVLTANNDYGNLIQIWDRHSRGLPLSQGEQRALGQAAKAWAISIVGLGAMSLIFCALGADDEDMAEVPDQIRATHWRVSINGILYLLPKDIRTFLAGEDGKTDWMIRMPKPFEIAWFANAVERAWDYFVNNDPTAARGMAKDFFTTVVPPHSVTGADLLYGFVLGKDMYSGNDIVPVFEKGTGELERAEQFSPYTTWSAKQLGNALNISPYYAEFIIRNLTASVGQDAASGIDAALGEGPLPSIAEYPVARRFTYNAGKSSESLSTFYNMMTEGEGLNQWFWNTLTEDARSFHAAANTYGKMIAAGGEDSVIASEYLSRINPDQRAYAILSEDFKGKSQSKYRNLHPMLNAAEGVKVTNAIMKEVVSGTLIQDKDKKFEEKKPLDREQMRFARNELGHIRKGLAQNALQILGVDGWRDQKLMDVDARFKVLKEGAPEVYDELMRRLKKEKVQEGSHLAKVWPKVKERIEASRKEADLGDLYGPIVGE